ncbi:MAG: 4'-phosphopantetheinyl transferase superfamily protein [Crocinitomicaceae bacterium]
MKKVLSESPLVIIADENYDCSLSLNHPIVQQDLENCHSEKRRKEIIFTRSLLHQELQIEELKKDLIGRPTLEKGDVSISHSGSLFGICYHPSKMVGLDIEIISEKPGRIKSKFQNESELVFDVSDQEITRLWTLKEAVYKYLSRPGVLFAEQIWIEKIDDENFKAEYQVNGLVKETIMLRSTIFKDHVISFTI